MSLPRKHSRTTAHIPIEVWETDSTALEHLHKTETSLVLNPGESEVHLEYLNNISLGGLAFESDSNWKEGALVGIRVQLESAFDIVGRIAWCRKRAGHYEVGIEFIGKSDAYKEDLVDAICQMETHKTMLSYVWF